MKSCWNKYCIHSFITILFLSLIMAETENNTQQEIEQATLGSGCFWCVEAVFERLNGVMDVRAGYAGGTTKDPTYEEVCSGKTGHAEVVQIDYSPHVISYKKLLDVFWESHDPTTLHRQGEDIGTQYRSVLFYHSDKQRKITEKSMKRADQSGLDANPIITAITPLSTFYPAEDYHQDYYRVNPNASYCRVVIQPKLDKLFKTE